MNQMNDEYNGFLFIEICIDTAEIVPMKVSLQFTSDSIVLGFFSRQFSSLRFTLPGRLPGPKGGQK